MAEKLNKHSFKFEGGQSLFEVIIALAISAIVIIALVAIAAMSVRNATFSKNKSLASRYAESATEWLRFERDNDPSNFQTKILTTSWCLKDLAWTDPGSCNQVDKITDTPFIREVTFTQSVVSNKSIVEVSTRVYWQDSQGVHEIRNATDFSDWREI